MKQNKILIYATTRSGSTYLDACVQNQTNIDPYHHTGDMNNIILNMSEFDRENYLKKILSEMKYRESYVVKRHPFYFVPHGVTLDVNRFIDEYVKSFNCVIALTRKDMINRAISIALMLETNWKYPYSYDRMKISSTRIDEALDTAHKCLEAFVKNERNIIIDRLCYYEDLTFNQKTDFVNLNISSNSQIFDNSLETVDRSPNKEDIIINYDEVYEHVSNYFKYISNERFQIKDGMIVALNNEHWQWR